MKKPWLLFPILAASLGCETILGIKPTEAAQDAAVAQDSSAAQEAPWSCVGHVDLYEPSSADFPVDLQVYDVATYAPPPGLSVLACHPLSCTDPVAGPLSANDAGMVQLTLPADFKGYLTIQSDTTLPAIVQVIRPLAKMSKLMPVELAGAQTVAALAALLATPIDSSRGILLMQALDCFGERGAGVAFELEQPAAGAQDFYFINQVPTLTKTGTDKSGGGGIVNVPTGFVAVHAVDVATGQLLANFSAQIQAGWITYVTVEPQ